MQLIRWNPAREFLSLNDHMNGLLDRFFYPASKNFEDDGLKSWNPVVDIYEEDKDIVFKAEIPGIEKEGITVDVKDRVLTIKGERSDVKEVDDAKYFRKERTYGRFERAFTLPSEVKAEDIKAKYKDGVLKVIVPKPEAQKPKQITVH